MSVAEDIGDAVKTALQAVTFEIDDTHNLPDASIVVRKYPELPPKQQPPQIVIVVGEESRTEPLTARQKLNRWNVAVVIITARGNKLEEDARLRTWREQISAKLYDQQRATFAGLSVFNECNHTGRSPFDPSALSKDLIFSTQNFEIQTIETLA